MASKRKKAWKEQLKATAVGSLANIAIREAVSAPFAAAGKRFLESTEGLQMISGVNKSNALTSQVNDYDTIVNRTGLGEEEFTRQALRNAVVGKVEAIHGDQWRTIAPWMPRQIDDVVETELPRQLAENQAMRNSFGGPTKTNAQTIKSIEAVNPHATGPIEWAAKGIGRLIGRRDSIEEERKSAVKTIAHGFGMTDFSESELEELTGLVMAGTSPIDVKWVRTNAEKLLGDKRLVQVEEQAVRAERLLRDGKEATLSLAESAADGTMSQELATEYKAVQAKGGANVDENGFVTVPSVSFSTEVLDATRVSWVTANEQRYMVPMITLASTDGAPSSLQTTNYLGVRSFLTFILDTEGLSRKNKKLVTDQQSSPNINQ